MDLDVSDNINWAFRTGKVLLRLAFLYEERVDPNCGNETSEVLRRGSSTRWQIWLVNSKVLTIGSNALRQFSDLSLLTFQLPFHTFKANCTLNSTLTRSNSSENVSVNFLRVIISRQLFA